MAWRAPRRRWIAVAAGIALAAAGHWVTAELLASSEPVKATVGSVAVVVTPGEAVNRDLVVSITAPIPVGCVRVSQQLLYREEPDGTRTFFPLGSALNGAGFGGSIPAGGAFRLALSLPASIVPGEYSFLHRSYYDCRWAWGLFARRIPTQIEPIRIVVR